MIDFAALREDLATHLHDSWPLLLNDGLQYEVADEVIGVIVERMK